MSKHHNRANASIQPVINILKNEGIDPELCLAGTPLTLDKITQADTEISDTMEIKIIEQALTLLPPRAGYGILAGQDLQLDNYGVWGLAVLTSPNVRSAFQTTSRFSEMSIMLSKVSLREGKDQVSLILDMGHLPRSIRPFIFERYFTMTVSFLQRMIPAYDFSKSELWLPFSDEVYETQLQALSGFSIKANAPYFAVSTSRSLLDYSFPKADSTIHSHFMAECESLLKSQTRLSDYSQRIRDYMLNEQVFSPKLASVAQSLFMSERTLRRRLAEEGHSFSDIVLDTKMRLAKELLVTASLPVKVVAARLEYAEPASFIRAFGKWWGVPPGKIKSTHIPVKYQ